MKTRFKIMCFTLSMSLILILAFGCNQISERKADDKYMTLDLGDGVTMKLVRIPAGEFMMGSDSEGDDDEQPVHKVRITEPFYMGVTEVTQEQYKAVMGENPSLFDGKQNPVEKVSWNNAKEFCEKLSRKTGKNVRLPTEAQWEYACRAGSTTAYCFGDSKRQLGDYAWYGANSDSRTHPVGQKKANDWGLYDMHGNVWEWCRDRYDSDYYENSPKTDPAGPNSGSFRVLRGGRWYTHAHNVRSANRNYSYPASTNYPYGFRVVLCVSSPQ